MRRRSGGIYVCWCEMCRKCYPGQTRRKLRERIIEHKTVRHRLPTKKEEWLDDCMALGHTIRFALFGERNTPFSQEHPWWMSGITDAQLFGKEAQALNICRRDGWTTTNSGRIPSCEPGVIESVIWDVSGQGLLDDYQYEKRCQRLGSYRAYLLRDIDHPERWQRATHGFGPMPWLSTLHRHARENFIEAATRPKANGDHSPAPTIEEIHSRVHNGLTRRFRHFRIRTSAFEDSEGPVLVVEPVGITETGMEWWRRRHQKRLRKLQRKAKWQK